MVVGKRYWRGERERVSRIEGKGRKRGERKGKQMEREGVEMRREGKREERGYVGENEGKNGKEVVT